VKYVGLWNAQLASPQVCGILSPFLDVIIQQVPAELHYTKKTEKITTKNMKHHSVC